MATNPSTKYPSQIDTTDPTGYPYGKAQNVTTSGDGSGTPLEQDWVNDVFGFFQALLDAANITPSGTPDKVGASQLLTALNTIYGARIDDVDLARAFNNMDFQATSPWDDGTTETVQELKYLPNAGRWWCITRDATGSQFRAYDSADGLTWSAGFAYDTGTSVGGITEDASGNVYVGSNLDIYESTTGLASGLLAQGPTFASLDGGLRDIVWDDVNSLFIVCGSNSTGGGEVETAATIGGTWTSRQSVAGPGTTYTDLAHDPVGGVTLVIGGGQTEYYYSSNGTTWTQETGPTFQPDDVRWSTALGKFAIWDLDGTGIVTTTDGTDFDEVLWPDGDGPERCIAVPEGLIVMWEPDTRERVRMECWVGIPNLNASSNGRYKAYVLGEFSASQSQQVLGLGRCDIQYAPQGRWVWPYDSSPDVKAMVAEF